MLFWHIVFLKVNLGAFLLISGHLVVLGMSSCCFSGILGPFGQCSKTVWVMGNFGRPYFLYVGLGAFLMFWVLKLCPVNILTTRNFYCIKLEKPQKNCAILCPSIHNFFVSVESQK